MDVPVRTLNLSLTDQVAERIRCDLMEHNLEEDDLFMTESQLAEHYEVSRNVIREAVSQLRALGIIKSRQKKGLLMGRTDPMRLFGHSLPFYPQSVEDINAISELRFVIEVGALPLAVQFATAEQIDTLDHIARRYSRRTEEKAALRELDGLDLTFHSLILEMTGNPLVAQLHEVIARFFEQAPEHFSDWQETQPHTASHHLALVEAIRDRDASRAHDVLSHHLATLVSHR